MKREASNIDQLFQKAANTRTHTSFDEAKDRFTKSLHQRNEPGKSNFRFLKWIIMITTILCGITAVTLAVFPENQEERTKSIQPIVKDTQAKKTEIPSSSIVVDVAETTAPPTKFETEMLAISLPMISHYLPEPQKLIFESRPKYYLFSNDLRDEKDSLEIPVLSEKEIAENNKRKRKMMKALAKKDKKQYAYIPAGSNIYKGQTYSVNAFFIQTKEVSNLEYRTFLNDLIIQGRKQDYKRAFPQTEQWTALIEGDLSSMQNLYHWHPAYDQYPVVNVTREGAEMYCEWITIETSKSKYVDDELTLNDVRLPQRTEWVYAASSGDKGAVYPWGSDSTKNGDGCYLTNYKPDSLSYFEDGAFHTAKTGTYNPTAFGLYNISGNVAEMVYGSTEFESKNDLIEYSKEAGTAGGGWMDDAETLKIEADDPYINITDGHPNIGFRPVMTYLRKSK